ncbi:excalibur calcium-binding domain-containing protein [Streptomyces sp. NBC_01298]|uniref:excalibur calcium-binding domain-containing protein n=1 Tax=Streptomyces sp. NBC_01298 TaxID=2903817 RepID=UPI002E0FB9FF|nr:excalibur calcium-binding domain-containing protein [Streptomyces sp. NBC_01298]
MSSGSGTSGSSGSEGRGGGSVHYQNCTAVRDAGAAPIRRGDAGYGSHLDRDGDGVACEWRPADRPLSARPSVQPASGRLQGALGPKGRRSVRPLKGGLGKFWRTPASKRADRLRI